MQLSRDGDAHVVNFVIDRQGTSGTIAGPGDLARKQNYKSKTVDDLIIAISQSLQKPDLKRKTDMNFEEKITTYKEVTENSEASSKNLKVTK